jgi:hypothetical protein
VPGQLQAAPSSPARRESRNQSILQVRALFMKISTESNLVGTAYIISNILQHNFILYIVSKQIWEQSIPARGTSICRTSQGSALFPASRASTRTSRNRRPQPMSLASQSKSSMCT